MPLHPTTKIIGSLLLSWLLCGACTAALTIPSPQTFSQSEVAHRYEFAPSVDQDLALSIMATYPAAYEAYEQSRRYCDQMNHPRTEESIDRCQRESQCGVVIAFGNHGMGGPAVCTTQNPNAQVWSQERQRRACLSTSDGVWQVYQLTQNHELYSACRVEPE